MMLLAVMTLQMTGCGYLMYPERRGQRGGRIDVGIAILDGVGLVFFLVPGIIAYAVDFSSGTIYVPGTNHASLDAKDLKTVSFDPAHYTRQGLEKLILSSTGVAIKMDQAGTEATRMVSFTDMKQHFALYADGKVSRFASLTQ
jgi:hypothetical protein